MCYLRPIMDHARRGLLALALLLAAPGVGAQQARVYLPPSAVLTNYDRVLIGQEEALESGAFVARVADSTAGWYNPAGLALVRRSVIGASATGYELATIDLGDIQTSSGKVTLAQLPSYFGAVLGGDVIASDRWRIGFSATKPTSWSTAVNGATPAGRRGDLLVAREHLHARPRHLRGLVRPSPPCASARGSGWPSPASPRPRSSP